MFTLAMSLMVMFVLVWMFDLADQFVRGESPHGPCVPRREWRYYKAEIVLDSVTEYGERITTFLLIVPKWIQAELNTHRAFSRNSSSSRAEPIMKRIRQVLYNPVVPKHWGLNERGMVAHKEAGGLRRDLAIEVWCLLRYPAILGALILYYLNIHKQIANRLIEPWTWMTIVVTATDFENFFKQRIHPDAQPEFAYVAQEMADLLAWHEPQVLKSDEWHLPFITYKERCDLPLATQIKVSIARCARASYGYGKGFTWWNDLKLFVRLESADPQHSSPFEHVATPLAGRHANLNGWLSYRTQQELQALLEETCRTLDDAAKVA